MISPDKPNAPRNRPIRSGLLILIVTLPLVGLGCGSSEAVVEAAPAQLPKIEWTKKERAKFQEMGREEMLEYKKQLRAERERRSQG